ncbi:MAG: phage major capsid protein [Bacteroidota bacterium]|nr:phage major capsid protein [Bacteroidota bacterium]
MKNNFSLVNTINEHISGRIKSPASIKMIEEGRAAMEKTGIPSEGISIPFEYRDLVAADSPLIGNEVLDFDGALRNELVFLKAGATFLTGLHGNVKVPRYSGTDACWLNETDSGNDSAGTFDTFEMKPKRLYATINIGKLFLLQANPSIEELLIKDISNAISEKLEATVLGNAAINTYQPKGFFTGITDDKLVIKGTASWDKVLQLEKTLNDAKARRDTRAYITTGSGIGVLKNTPKIQGFPNYISQDGKMNDYPVFYTNNMASGLTATADEQGLVFANWSDLIIAQWGAIDILVDPFTLSHLGMVKLGITGYFDAAKRRDEAFAIGSVK